MRTRAVFGKLFRVFHRRSRALSERCDWRNGNRSLITRKNYNGNLLQHIFLHWQIFQKGELVPPSLDLSTYVKMEFTNGTIIMKRGNCFNSQR